MKDTPIEILVVVGSGDDDNSHHGRLPCWFFTATLDRKATRNHKTCNSSTRTLTQVESRKHTRHGYPQGGSDSRNTTTILQPLGVMTTAAHR